MKMDDDDIVVNTEMAFFSGNGTFLQRIKRWTKYFACIVVTLAFLVLTGWHFNIEFPNWPVPHLASISPAMVFAFIFSGIFFLLFVSENKLKQKNAAAFISFKVNRTNCNNEKQTAHNLLCCRHSYNAYRHIGAYRLVYT